jgi:hypothetical protein
MDSIVNNRNKSRAQLNSLELSQDIGSSAQIIISQ